MTRFAEGPDRPPEAAPPAESHRTVGRVVFDAVRSHGVRHVFCVPGESYLGLMDAFHGSSSPTLVTTRHEEGAGVMAEAQARLTGRPGVAMVTRGPGVTHLSIAVHTAMQDGVPLVGFVGQVPTRLRGRGAFQEVEVAQLGKTLGKWGVEINDPEHAPELVARAFEVAMAGRPGPVLVSVPEDVGTAPVQSSFTAATPAPVQTFDREPVRRAASIVHSAPSVALVVGDAVRRAGAGGDLDRLASTLGAPVYTAWRQYDAFPNDHRLYAGPLPWLPPEMLQPLRDARVLLVVGTQLDDFSSLHYTLPGPEQQLVSLDAKAGEPSHKSAGAVHAGGDLRRVLESFNDALDHHRGEASRPGAGTRSSSTRCGPRCAWSGRR